MAREVSMTSQRQGFWKEALLKETSIRLAWHRDIGKKYAKTATRRTHDIKTVLPTIPVIKKQEIKEKDVAEKLRLVQEKMKPVDDLVEMRPVSAETKEVLYHGFSKDETGRHKYLQKRKLKKPEEKYTYPLTSNWAYGWDQGHMEKTYVPPHGKSRIVQDTFLRKSGVFSGSF
ncbi:protein ATP6V1FNB-like [Huso huso]